MSGALDELYEGGEATNEGAAATPAPEPVVAQPPAGEPAPVQSQEAQAAEVQPQAAPPSPPVQEHAQPPLAPVTALLDERERRQAIQRERDELRAQLEAYERAKREAQEQAPNILDDPEGYHAYMTSQIMGLQRSFDARLQQALTSERMSISEDRWRDKLGDEDWKKLNDWIKSWPQQAHRQAMSQRDPYGWAWGRFQQIEKAQRFKTIEEKLGGKDPDAWLEEKLQERLAAQSPQPQPAAQPQAQAPDRPRNPDGTFASPSEQQPHRPASLSQMNGSAVHTPTAPGSVLDELYS